MEEKARNYVIKNVLEDPNEETTKITDLKLVQLVLFEANVNVNVVVKVERHVARVPGRSEHSRLLKVFIKSEEVRDTVKRIIARYKQKFLPVMAYVRDVLSPKQLQLDSRLRDKCSA